MALTATFSSGGDFETAEDGRYVCTLTGVKREARPSFDDPTVLEDNFVWAFASVREVDSQDRPYKFVHFTKTDYSNPKAKLTLMVNGIFGRAFLKTQVDMMDFEKLIGKTVALMIGTTASGKNKVLSVKGVASHPIKFEDIVIDGADPKVTPPPAKAASSAKVTPSADDDDDLIADPFGD